MYRILVSVTLFQQPEVWMIVPGRWLFRSGLYRSLARRRRPGHRLSASPEPGTREVAPQCLHPNATTFVIITISLPNSPSRRPAEAKLVHQTSPDRLLFKTGIRRGYGLARAARSQGPWPTPRKWFGCGSQTGAILCSIRSSPPCLVDLRAGRVFA